MTDRAASSASIDQLRREVLGDVSPKVAGVAPSIGQLAASFAYGEVWSRPGLSKRDRSIVTFSALVALSATEELQLHALRGLANGISKDEIGEILTQLAPYVGFPLVVAAATKIADLVDRADVGGPPPVDT